ncbi:late competence development ComFB family protein [Halonatronum saccharophilum]|uniref:late competence development ComFB family protein n=1 Tax=Halonatronum saccharophilum TaxID=150060 RepID=UPI0004B5560D|nr:late competence development ComFB family protein [Halonatronum saccharophilum]
MNNNLLEVEVVEKIKEVLSEREDLCDCKQCQRDIYALALKNLQPRYAGSEEGRILLDSVDISSTQTKMDILRVVVEAAQKVSKLPHHNR